jgi:hypothetical protein
MKFESKKWVLRVALAGALSMGVANVAKADDSTVSTVAPPVWNVLAQEDAVQKFGTNGGGSSLNFILQNVRLKGTFGIDAEDTVTLQSSFASVGGLTLLDAYDVHTFSDLMTGLSAKVGEFKIPFGNDQYLNPEQLIRANYSIIDSLIPAGIGGTTGNAWDLGGEIDQTFSDLTFQAAVVQNPNGINGGATNKDYVGRLQWKGTNLALGLSDYYSATSINLANNLNTLGANATLNIDVVQLDLEAIFGRFNQNGYMGTLSAKFNSFQPAVWYDFSLTGNGTVGSIGDDLGLGLNFWMGAKTRLALNLDFTGPQTGDILLVNTETFQLQEVF